MLVKIVLACNQLRIFVEMKNWIQKKMPDQLPISHLELHKEEVTAVAHHKPQVCAADDRLPKHEQSIRATGDQSPSQATSLCREWPCASLGQEKKK